jgi:DsbC/DsbD-like thiol-disulfide interchange protein
MRIAFAGALAVALAWQAPTVKDGIYDTSHLTVTTSASETGRRHVTLTADVIPKPKMHVYAPGQDGYIVVALTLDANPAFTAAKATYPAPEKLVLKELNEKQLVYAKPFRIVEKITLSERAPDAPVTIKGTLRYQACDDRVCYQPITLPIEWKLAHP